MRLWGSILAGAILTAAAPADTDRLTWPTDYRASDLHYATIDQPLRKMIHRLYANPTAVDAVRRGGPFPTGTRLIMEVHAARLDDAGRPLTDPDGGFLTAGPIAVYVMQKSAGQGEAPSLRQRRSGEWTYGEFDPGGRHASDDVSGCVECHHLRRYEDFVFSRQRLEQHLR